MNGFTIRPVAPGDADGVNAIYNPYIMESPATFETEPYDADMRRQWIAARAEPRHPGFVAVSEAGVIGFANAARFDERKAYETSVKVSVFVAQRSQSGGVGRALYQTLFNALARVDVHRAYALIVAPNPASVALHVAFGFTHVSTLSEVGRKFGRYWDVMWFERRL